MLLPDRTRPRSELGDLAESFYLMSGNILEFKDNVESISERYRPFVPDAILAMFGKEDILEIRPGDSVPVEGELLELEGENFFSSETEDGAPQEDEAEEQEAFLARNRFLAAAAEITEQNNGIVISMSGNGMTAFFPESGEAVSENGIPEEQENAQPERDTPAGRAYRQILALKPEDGSSEKPEARLARGNFLLEAEGSEHFMTVRLIKTGRKE